LTGELEYAKFNKDSILSTADDVPSQADLSASKQELELREQVAREEKRLLSTKSKNRVKNRFYL
jgi:hypothetical protein